MPIKCTTNLNDLFDKLDKNIGEMLDKAVDAMTLACLNTVAAARQLNTYTDRTGNLRSSIGYVVYKDGVEASSNFEAHGVSESGSTGVSEGEQLARDVASKYGNQVVAVLVAGMSYAVYVESKGFDVISGPWLEFRDLFEQYYKA